jgi:hypothetical protein
MVTEERCHVRSEPEEMPPPTIPVRNRDFVRYRARMKGFEAMLEHAKGQSPGFLDFSAGVDVMNEYIRNWDRRRSALDEVL